MTEWVWQKGLKGTRRRAVAGVLWALHELGGSIESESGMCQTILRDYLEPRGISMSAGSFSHCLKEMEDGRYGEGLIERLTGPKRTYRVELTWDGPLPERPWTDAPSVKPAEPVEAPVPEVPTGDVVMSDSVSERRPEDTLVAALAADVQCARSTPRVEDEDALSPVDKLLVISRMSTEVLVEMAELLSHVQQPERADDVMLRRLADASDEVQRLRRKLSIAEETALAKSKEVEALRRAKAVESIDKDRTIKQLQDNLAAITHGSRVNDSGFRALDKMVRERPKVSAS